MNFIHGEIARMRVQVSRQPKDIFRLQRAVIPAASAKALLQRTRDRVGALCVERDRLKTERPGHNKDKVLGGRRW